jgi:hypothetical protein
MEPKFAIYDPRQHQEYAPVDFLTKMRFSNLEAGFIVAEGEGIDWGERVSLLSEAILRTSKLGFVTVDPWIPHTKEVMRALRKDFPINNVFRKTGIAYCGLGVGPIEHAFDLRRRCGQDVSGEWCVGGCIERFAVPRRVSLFGWGSWNYAHILGQAERLGCVLYLAEMQQSVLAVRVFDGLDEWLSRLNLSVVKQVSVRPTASGEQ